MPAVTSVQQLAALARLLRSDGDKFSTIPLPHAIHSAVNGWTRSLPGARDNTGKHAVVQVMVGQPAPAVIQSPGRRCGNTAGS